MRITQFQVFQVCQSRADLERQEALERAPARMGVPGLTKPHKPGTARGPGAVSSKGGRARPVKTTQTWNGKRPWSGLQQGWVCQVCKNRADLERHHAIDAAPEGAGVPGLTKPHKPGTGPCLGGGSTRGRLIFSLHSLTVAQQIIFYLCRH